MTADDDRGDGEGASPSVAQIARATAHWLRQEQALWGRRYVRLSQLPGDIDRDLAHADASPASAGLPPRPAPSSRSTDDAARARLPVLDSAHEKLEWLRTSHVGDCQRCVLARTRTKLVFGAGDPNARLMFVGEAPGADEDTRGEPFVGAAGRRLDEWLCALGIARSDVYIANVLKCRPPRNRDPDPQEIAKCSPFLHAQIRAINPSVLVALGRFAGEQLLAVGGTLASMRGAGREYVEPKSGARIPVVVTYHPSYVLRREGEAQGDTGRKHENEIVLDDLRVALSHAARG